MAKKTEHIKLQSTLTRINESINDLVEEVNQIKNILYHQIQTYYYFRNLNDDNLFIYSYLEYLPNITEILRIKLNDTCYMYVPELIYDVYNAGQADKEYISFGIDHITREIDASESVHRQFFFIYIYPIPCKQVLIEKFLF